MNNAQRSASDDEAAVRTLPLKRPHTAARKSRNPQLGLEFQTLSSVEAIDSLAEG